MTSVTTLSSVGAGSGASSWTRGLPDAVHEQRRVDRLLHEVHRAEIGTLHEHLVIVDRGCNDYARRLLLGLQPRQQRHTVDTCQHEVEHHHVGLKFVNERLCAQPVVRLCASSMSVSRAMALA